MDPCSLQECAAADRKISPLHRHGSKSARPGPVKETRLTVTPRTFCTPTHHSLHILSHSPPLEEGGREGLREGGWWEAQRSARRDRVELLLGASPPSMCSSSWSQLLLHGDGVLASCQLIGTQLSDSTSSSCSSSSPPSGEEGDIWKETKSGRSWNNIAFGLFLSFSPLSSSLLVFIFEPFTSWRRCGKGCSGSARKPPSFSSSPPTRSSLWSAPRSGECGAEHCGNTHSLTHTLCRVWWGVIKLYCERILCHVAALSGSPPSTHAPC